MATRIPRIACVGSLNIDLIASVERLPRAGETIAARQLTRRFGGKGGNQAIAAARQGAQVSMIACVGADPEGASYREHLIAEGIDCDGIDSVTAEPTGTAMIAVDAKGENQIVVAAGANAAVRPPHLRDHASAIEQADVLLLQLEVPIPAVVESMSIARRAKVPIVFTAAPWRADFPWGRHPVDFALVNAEEARAMFGKAVSDASAATSRKILPTLSKLGVSAVIITRGEQPTLCFTADEAFEMATMKVSPVDTVGAGDAFAGALAVALGGGKPLREAVCRANYAGAMATLKRGAQEALPTAAQVDRALRRIANS